MAKFERIKWARHAGWGDKKYVEMLVPKFERKAPSWIPIYSTA
jgi:hypothetical protein